MKEIKYWVWLSSRFGMRPKTKCRLLETFGDPKNIYFADESAYKTVEKISVREIELLKDKSWEKTEKILNTCERKHISILTIADKEYPARLKNIFDPPAVLYVLGRLPNIDDACAIAIVGTRKATSHGFRMARRLGDEITAQGGLVISGLAAGIDAAGAVGALRARGICVGVLGTAIDKVYPACSRNLFEEVPKEGAIISEYPPGAPYDRSSFPMRNRIMSGLSVGTLVVEAPKKSGALITAALALEQGRDVFAVPGNADELTCEGSNQLICDGAKAIMKGEDIMSEYELLYPQVKSARKMKSGADGTPGNGSKFRMVPIRDPDNKPFVASPSYGWPQYREDTEKDAHTLREQLNRLSETQLQIVSAISESDTHVDIIADRTGLPVQTILAELTVLQIEGVVTQRMGKLFSLNIAVSH